MMNRKTLIYSMVAFVFFYGCVEEIELETFEDFKSALVIEATIDDQLKFQKVELSRSYDINSDGPSFESQAMVIVKASNGNSYEFKEDSPGNYISINKFKADSNVGYELSVVTKDGRLYGSEEVKFSGSTKIDALYLERGFNENNQEGVSFYVDSFDPQGESHYYRYTYEETYKIVAPSYSGLDLVTTLRVPPFDFELQLKQEPQQICYNTVNSNQIIISNTNIYSEDRIDRFRVRFVNRQDYIISHRYSILVTQYIQSNAAFSYYKILKELSDEESLFSQIQPGFLNGNVFSQSDGNELVIGFFEVAKTDKKRIYFNYEDVFPGEVLPPYYVSCGEFAPETVNESGDTSPLMDALDSGNKYYKDNNGELDGGPFLLVPPPCGNCTIIGLNVPPVWWEE